MPLPLSLLRRMPCVLFLCMATNAIAQPKILSFSPLNGPVGTTVTITGSGFNATAVANIVYFGPVRAVVTGGSANSLTVTVPAGASYKPVSVLNTATGLAGYSSRPFSPTFTNPAGTGIPADYFETINSFPSAGLPGNIAIGDIEGDGKPDLFMADEVGDLVIQLNRSAKGLIDVNSFSKINLGGASGNFSSALVDVDGDGKPDLVSSSPYRGSIQVYRNTSTPGNFSTASPQPVVFGAGQEPRTLLVSDVDADGKPDLVIGNQISNTISVLRNTATAGTINASSFAPVVTIASGLFAVAAGDIDGDGKPDIVATSATGTSVLRNISTPGSILVSSFAPGVNVAPSTGFDFLGDLDGDGRPDLIIGNSYDSITVFRNSASPGSITASSFLQHAGFSIDAYSYYGQKITIGDVDGDGKPDIAGANSYAVSILRNTSAPGSITAASFAGKINFAIASGSPNDVAVQDLDGDGIAEVLATSSGSSKLSVLKTDYSILPPSPPPPAVTSVTPVSGPAGTAVTITGANFNSTAAANTVFFGAVKGMVASASSTSLTVKVPAGATYQPVSVLNSGTGLTGYASKSFITTFASPFGSEIPAYFYNPPVKIPASILPGTGTLADLDGDGKPELITLGNYQLSVMHNISTTGAVTPSSFGPEVLYPVRATYNEQKYIAVADMDADGKPDIVVVNKEALSVYHNTSVPGSINASSFAVPVDFGVGGAPTALAIGDLDIDGKPDVAVASSAGILIYRNSSVQGSITVTTFTGYVNLLTDASSSSLAIRDLDGDGKPEIVACIAPYYSPGSLLSVFHNNARPGIIKPSSFGAAVNFTTPSDCRDVAIGDIDGDEKPDLVITNPSSNSISVLRNTAVPGSITASSFAAKVDFATDGSSFTKISDVNGDGKPDLITSGTGISILTNLSTPGSIDSGSFSYRTSFAISSPPVAITSGDLNGDGIAELTAIGGDDSYVSVFTIAAPPANPVPLVTNLTPASGAPGTSIVISGSGFNAAAASNTVYFGAVKAVVTAASSTRLTVTVPAGATYKPVIVLNNVTGLSASSPLAFNPTFPNPYGNTIPPTFYKTPVNFGAGAVPYSVASGDLDGDGKPDMVVVNANANTISVLRNISSAGSMSGASFAGKVDFATGTDPRAVAIGDLDGDGKPDIAITNLRSGTVSVFRNTSTAGSINSSSLAARIDFPTGTDPISVTIGDLNADGKPDLAVANLTSNTVSVLQNVSAKGSINSSSFTFKVNLQIFRPRFVATGDLDGDSKPELVIVSEGFSYESVTIFQNISTGNDVTDSSFGKSITKYLDNGVGFTSVAIGDLDEDGKPDLAIANYTNSNVALLRNTLYYGQFTLNGFSNPTYIPTGRNPFFVAMADADGDGKPDLLTANSEANTVTVLRNGHVTGNIGNQYDDIDPSVFAFRKDFPTGNYPLYLAAGDLDGDGLAEVAVACANSNAVSVLKINPPSAPVITSFNPGSGRAGSSVTITGLRFNPSADRNTVYFGAVQAAVTNASSTSMTVTVPAGATYRPLSVLNKDAGLTGYSSSPFITTFTNPFGTGIPAGFYKPKTDFTAGSLPYAVAAGDMDGDGKPDLVIANANASTVSVLRNTSPAGSMAAPAFAGKVDFTTGDDPRSVMVSDIDGDGRLDIIVANARSSTLSVLRNTSVPGSITAASFAAKVDFPADTVTYHHCVAIGDLDSDGKPDLVVGNLLSGTVGILHNLSAPGSITAASFATRVSISTGVYPRYISISDVDGDGRPDLVVANERSNSVSVIHNNTSLGSINASSFDVRADFPVGSNPSSVATGDVDGDGKPDIVVSNYASNSVSVLRNTSTAGTLNAQSFAAGIDLPAGIHPFFVAIGDADGDGKVDLVTANADNNTVSVLRNTANPGSINPASFAGKADFGTGGYPLCIAMADVDGDGIPETIAANANSNSVSVLKVNTAAAVAGNVVASKLNAEEPGAMQLYPNPTNGNFTLQLARLSGGIANLEILNESGTILEKRVLNNSGKTASLRLSLRGQPAGVYYVKVTGIDGVRITKVILQR